MYKRRRIGSLPGESGAGIHQQQQAAAGNNQQQQDHYALLGLTRDADADAIKHAYHKLARKYHPDRNKGNEVECEIKFKELAAAYAVLSDPEKRQQYDLSLLSTSSSSRFFGSNDLREVFNQFVSSGSTTSFSDFFGSFSTRSFSSRSFSSFSSGSTSSSSSSSSSSDSGSTPFGQQGSFSFNKKRPPVKGQNLRTTVRVSFAESVFGCTKTIALKTLGWCTVCGGLGVDRYSIDHRSRTSAVDCTACGGTGTYSQRSSVVTINSTCTACGGKGIVVDETTKCKCCHNGRVHQTKELRIEVPAGVMNNMRKMYEGEGDVGEYGGVPGDLIIVFDVEDSPLFSREGDDAMCDVSISFFQAALGAVLMVPGLYGQPLRLEVPPGTQPHDVLRIDDEGFVNVSSKKRGHLYVRIVLDVPRALSPQQIELLLRAQHQWNEAIAASSAAVAESVEPQPAAFPPTSTLGSEFSDPQIASFDPMHGLDIPSSSSTTTTTSSSSSSVGSFDGMGAEGGYDGLHDATATMATLGPCEDEVSLLHHHHHHHHHQAVGGEEEVIPEGGISSSSSSSSLMSSFMSPSSADSAPPTDQPSIASSPRSAPTPDGAGTELASLLTPAPEGIIS